MSYEIIGETIKSATSIKLGDIFKVATIKDGVTTYTYPTRYKENITKPKYPSFWIIQVSQSVTPKGLSNTSALNSKRNRIQIDYLINIQYRLAENTETVSNLRQQLDAVGLKLNTEFTELNLEKPTKIKNARYEIVDGVLQFFFNITVFAIPDIDDDVLMNILTPNINIEEV